MSRPSPARRALLWWFGAPANAHMSASIGVDFTEARRYLEELGRQGQKVSVHHLVVAAIARVLREYPAANARVFGNRIVRKDAVGVAMPVNLVGHPGEARAELTLSVVAEVDRMSLTAFATQTSKSLKTTRTGENDNGFTASLFRFAELAPDAVFLRTLNGMDRIASSSLGPLFYRLAPITTAITNPGAAFGSMPGVWFRGAGVSLPQRLISVGTLWGISAVQEEVVPVDGLAVVRPVLPVVLAFDHRLFDGVMAGRILVRFAEILHNPAAIFGTQGEKSPAEGLSG